jgi:hypothetical protein
MNRDSPLSRKNMGFVSPAKSFERENMEFVSPAKSL